MSAAPEQTASEPSAVPSDPEAASPRPRWPGRLLLLATAVVVFGPVVCFETGPAEVAKWHLGAAREHDLSGRDAQALASYDKALQWHADLWLIYEERAAFHAARDQHEQALANWDQSIESFPFEDRTQAGRRLWVFRRGEHLIRLGRYSEALRDAKRLLTLAPPNDIPARAPALNWISYLRAVANRDVETALVEIDEAFRLLRENGYNADQPSYLDTRGFILYRLGRYDEALEEMDRAIRLMTSSGAANRVSEERRRRILDTREAERQSDFEARVLAVMYYHRALILEQLGESARANRDYETVRNMGFEPSPELF